MHSRASSPAPYRWAKKMRCTLFELLGVILFAFVCGVATIAYVVPPEPLPVCSSP